MAAKTLKEWTLLVVKHLAGQSLVNVINISTGLLLLRLLPVQEFALYTLALALLQMAVIASDTGLAQAVNTIGARMRDQRTAFGQLYVSACSLGRRFYMFAAPIVVLLFAFSLNDHRWSWIHMAACTALVIVIGGINVTVNIRKSVLNVHHDANALLSTGMAEATTRLALLPFCALFPYAAVALAGTLAGTVGARWVSAHYARRRLDADASCTAESKRELTAFILPLVPVLIYHTLQGQLSVLLLSTLGLTSSIAEFGALGRLAQLITVPMLLNGFLVQPVFSRINNRAEFIRKAVFVFGFIALSGLAVMASAFVVPQWWLLILGKHYSNLSSELPIALLTALTVLLGGTLYTLVISRDSTRGQWWYIAAGLSGQAAFLLIHGVTSTSDALLLSLVPVVAYALVQLTLLAKVLWDWNDDAPSRSRAVSGT